MFGIAPKLQKATLAKLTKGSILYNFCASPTGPFTGKIMKKFSKNYFSNKRENFKKKLNVF